MKSRNRIHHIIRNPEAYNRLTVEVITSWRMTSFQQSSAARDGLFNFVSGVRKSATQVDQLAVFIDVKSILDADPQFLFRYVNAWFDRKNHARPHRHFVVPFVMDIKPDVVAQAMNEVSPQRLSLHVFAVSID